MQIERLQTVLRQSSELHDKSLRPAARCGGTLITSSNKRGEITCDMASMENELIWERLA